MGDGARHRLADEDGQLVLAGSGEARLVDLSDGSKGEIAIREQRHHPSLSLGADGAEERRFEAVGALLDAQTRGRARW